MFALWMYFWDSAVWNQVAIITLPPVGIPGQVLGPKLRWLKGGFGNFWMP